MTDTDLRHAITDSLAEVAPDADLARLDEAVSFHDQFEMDSVDYLNFVLSLERRLGIHVPEADYPRLSSFAGAEAYLRGMTASSRPAAVGS